MAEEVSNTTETKTTSDGRVDISIEKYEELVEQANRPTVVNRTVVHKTDEMLAKEQRAIGGTFMGLGGALFTVGLGLFKTAK